jgi:hypothetical protein
MARSSFNSESGVSLIGLTVILPLLLFMLWFIVGFGSVLNQAMWVEQTAYNSTVMSAELDSKLTVSQKESAVVEVVNLLKKAHLDGGHKVFIGGMHSAVTPYDPGMADDKDPSTFMTSVQVGGELLNLFNSKLSVIRKVFGRALITSPPTNDSPTFGSSKSDGTIASVNCCGSYGSNSSSCVSGQKYTSSCDPSDPGYWPP